MVFFLSAPQKEKGAPGFPEAPSIPRGSLYVLFRYTLLRGTCQAGNSNSRFLFFPLRRTGHPALRKVDRQRARLPALADRLQEHEQVAEVDEIGIRHRLVAIVLRVPPSLLLRLGGV